MADFTPSPPTSIADQLLQKLYILIHSDDGLEDDSPAVWYPDGVSDIIYIGNDAGADAIGGFRFKQAIIPNNAKITKAVLRLRCTGAISDPTNLKIKGIKEVSPNTFAADGSNKPSTRPKTTAAVDWDFAGGGGAGVWVESPDIKTIIQEIIDQPEFDKKAIVLVVEPDTDCENNKLLPVYDSNKGAGYEAQLVLTIEPSI